MPSMKARYKILLVGNLFFFLVLIVATTLFNAYIKDVTRNTGAGGLLIVIIFMQIGIFAYLFFMLVITLMALGWASAKGKFEVIAAAKIELVIVSLTIIVLTILSKAHG
jgi:hypothetical protein